MRFVSTRGQAPAVGLSRALAAGLAPDGGLYVPEHLPRHDPADFPAGESLARTTARLLRPFFEGDALAPQLDAICAEALDLPLPLRPLRGPGDHVLELFHGPTCAFKDFAARFLAACLQRLQPPDAPLTTVLVATSGDTGAAVAAAFHRRPGFRVLILYPDGRVSARQAHQLGAFGDNVRALRVAGRFDDCQRLVKAALADTALRTERPLATANSISLGRLLPQAGYYAHAALALWRERGDAPGFIVPSGNLGNALACALARAMGLPIGPIGLACNANRALPSFFAGGAYRPRRAVATLANAMDVGAPSNFERLGWLEPDPDRLRTLFRAQRVDDRAIRRHIRRAPRHHGIVACPHTATALAMLERLRREGCTAPLVAVATAHPAKFADHVEPLAGTAVEVPPALAALLQAPSHADPVPADLDVLRGILRADW